MSLSCVEKSYYLSGQKYIPSVELHTFDMNAKNKYVYPPGTMPPANTKLLKHLLISAVLGLRRTTVPSLANNPIGGSFVFGLLTSANSLPAFQVPASRICARERVGVDPPVLEVRNGNF